MTSSDVARHAGVSRATVSHVLNGQGDRFPEETRRKVLAAAAALEYLPSPAGRALANGRGDTVVFLLPDTTFRSGLQDAVDLVAEATAPLGANVVVRFAGRAPATTTSLMRLRPLAVLDFSVLSTEDRMRLEAAGALVLPRNLASDAYQEWRSFDDTVAELQVGALTVRGPREMYYATLRDDRSVPYGLPRADSFTVACEKRGLGRPGSVAIPLELAGAVEALGAIKGRAPLAVACYNDYVALAVMAAVRELGLSVPGDIVVVGVDDVEVGQLWSPRLTTVRIDLRQVIGRIVAELREALGASAVDEPGFSPDEDWAALVPGETT
ncbi:LacI family DNA-binding transcriptional regulator [Streptomyces sp. ME02-7008A-1]|uniref:LacI family DNA-binding transcriptional regulator n=1 Tax=unclassified Streptomyces TaxID=2593676 RepID=UPI0029ADB27C|nr:MULTISPECIES: LacI family DNA-binding transcriptional regulator [unclassified Streptomyces]MDX3179660.1 LacI family DNA-binding transcriptional regulator [Streptomyces sp. ME02-7008A-1]MDX3300401.1 LacI family DNA-binding transcriptional regulator [Streptomyces sp. ME02-7008A]